MHACDSFVITIQKYNQIRHQNLPDLWNSDHYSNVLNCLDLDRILLELFKYFNCRQCWLAVHLVALILKHCYYENIRHWILAKITHDKSKYVL